MQYPDLHGRTALITGGGRGIGRAAALLLARCGAKVVVTARDGAQINAVAHEVISIGGEALAVPCDVSQEDGVRKLMGTADPVDVLVNNAGVIWPIDPVVRADPAQWRQDIEINLYGVFLTTHYALPGMLERGWGRIINVSSGAARGSTAGWSAYSAAKAGVEVLTRITAVEVGEGGVRVNAVRPGVVDTEMQVEIRDSSEEQFGTANVERFRGYKERGVLRDPADPAKLIAWLLTPEADGLNGETLSIDDPEVSARLGLPLRAR